MNNTKTRLCILVLVASLVTFMLPYVKLAYADVNVAVYPSTIVAELGNSFTVNITTSNVNNLYGWEFKLNWSTSCLDVNNVTEGPLLKKGGNTFFTNRINSTTGRLIADCTLLGQVPGVDGSGTLASVTFYVKTLGQSVLDLYNATLLDDSPGSLSIPCQTVGGYWSSQHDVAITNISFAPTSVLPGQLVSINITAINHGVFAESFNVTAFISSQVIGKQAVSLNPGSSTILPFAWDTTEFEKGEYWLFVSADVVSGEVDVADNNRTSANPVTVLAPVHDVAVTDVEPSKTIVGQGFCMFINVTVRNFGTYSETFNVTTYANDTAIHSDAVSLASGQSAELSLLWNTSSFLMSNYLIRSYAEPVSLETDVSDNTYTFGLVTIAKRGDMTSVTPNVPDGRVDMRDLAAVARSFGMHPGGSLWNGNADITGITLGLPDNVIDMRDVSWVAISFGK